MRFLLSVFLGSVVLAAVAQKPYFQQYHLLRKSDPVKVNAILQDRAGFMWFGTDHGLFRFDGFTKTQFTTNDSLPDNMVTALAEDSLGRIWAGHRNGRLAIIEGDRIHPFEPEEGSAVGEVSDILFDKQGNLWFSTLNDGLYYFLSERLYRLDDMEGLPDLFVYDLELDDEGRIWVGTDGGVAVCTLQDTKAVIKVINYDQGLPDNIVKKIQKGIDGNMWMATEDQGVVRYDPSNATFDRPFDLNLNSTVNDLLIDRDRMWVVSNHSLITYDLTLNEMRKYSELMPGTGTFETLWQDREGNLWVGTNLGLIRCFGDYLELMEAKGMDRSVQAVAADKAGAIWYATSEGLYRARPGDRDHTSVLAQSPYRDFNVISLYVDEMGYVWAGLYGEGVLRINSNTGSIQHFRQQLRNGNVLNISGQGDVVWLATLGGAVRVDLSGDDITFKNISREDGLVSDYIYQVFADSQDRIWFATDRAGVDMLDGEEFHHFAALNFKVVFGFAEDANHKIWANVQDEGLFCLEDSVFVSYDSIRLRDRNIHIFTSNQQGQLVMVHDYGIDWYDVNDHTVRYLGEEAGLRDQRPNLNAIAHDGRGALLFGTESGIVIFRSPGEGFQRRPVPQIVGVSVHNQSVADIDNLQLSYNENFIIFNYTGFWYQGPENLTYYYHLDNHDLEWIATRDRFVTYSNLLPGSYTLRIKASATGNLADAEETTLSFIINPPFWRTTAFYVFALAAVGFLVYSIIRARERKLIADKHLLEAKVEERTLEIQRKNEEILSQSEEINSINENLEKMVEQRTQELAHKNKALEEYAFITAHKLRSPVATLLGLIHLCEKLELPHDDKVIISHIKDSTEKLDEIVKSILRAIEKGDSATPGR